MGDDWLTVMKLQKLRVHPDTTVKIENTSAIHMASIRLNLNTSPNPGRV